MAEINFGDEVINKAVKEALDKIKDDPDKKLKIEITPTGASIEVDKNVKGWDVIAYVKSGFKKSKPEFGIRIER